MREEKVEIKTGDGIADAFVYAPDAQGPLPAVLYYPDGIGIRPAFHQMAQRLAAEGYVVLLPNIYYRTTTGPFFDLPLDFNDPKTRARFMELSGPLTPDAMERDALSYLEFLGQRPDVNGRMGVVGYCLTGRMAMRTAAVAPDRILAAAAFHGGGLYAEELHEPTQCAAAHQGAAVVRPCRKRQLDAGRSDREARGSAQGMSGTFESETYPAKHGWCVPGSEVYDEVQAERHYAKLKGLFAEALR